MSVNVIDQAEGENWKLYLGDSCQVMQGLPDNSVDFSVYSPPFGNLYIYSDSEADLGNSANYAEFFEHYRYIIREKLRATVPGGLTAVHCKDLPLYKTRDTVMGLYDFPGDIVRSHVEEGWAFHSRVTVWKCPKTEMERTKNHGLLYCNLQKNSRGSRQGMADYVLVFRKWAPGMEEHPVPQDKKLFPVEQWRVWASPVWTDIQQPNVLNFKMAKDNEDERHICPLQLDLIERCVRLWSNPCDVVFTPFAGIGSEVYVAAKCGRKAVGIELKPSYWEWAVKNLRRQDGERQQMNLLDFLDNEDFELEIDTSDSAPQQLRRLPGIA